MRSSDPGKGRIVNIADFALPYSIERQTTMMPCHQIAPALRLCHKPLMALTEKKTDMQARKPLSVSNPLERFLGYQLRRASQAMLTDLGAALAKLDIKVTEMSVLLVIGANPGITQSEVSRVLAIQRANMVPLVTQLERRGMIRRAITTGRAQALRLTPAGRNLMRQCQQSVTQHEKRFLPDIPKTEKQTLIETLRLAWATQD